MEKKIELIRKITKVILGIMNDERQAITTANWQQLDSLIRRKTKLLQKLENVGFEPLNDLYVFDPRVVEIKDLIQQIVNVEDQNAALLKIQMQEIKQQLVHVKDVIKTAVYGTSHKESGSVIRHAY